MIGATDPNKYCIDATLVEVSRPVIDALRAAGLSLVTPESSTV